MNKPDYISALGILLSLEKPVEKELNSLSKEALAQIYDNYRQNAVNAQNAFEFATAHSYKLGLSAGGAENTRLSPRDVVSSATHAVLNQRANKN